MTVKNARSVSTAAVFPSCLEDIEIDNSVLKSTYNGFDTVKKTVITDASGTTLFKILPCETHFRNNGITSVQYNFIDITSNLTYLEINNSHLKTVRNKILMSADETVLY